MYTNPGSPTFDQAQGYERTVPVPNYDSAQNFDEKLDRASVQEDILEQSGIGLRPDDEEEGLTGDSQTELGLRREIPEYTEDQVIGQTEPLKPPQETKMPDMVQEKSEEKPPEKKQGS
jgi:hypothetical protein